MLKDICEDSVLAWTEYIVGRTGCVSYTLAP